MLYQTLQSKIINKEKIKQYSFIVADEFHYVLTDSMFNICTDVTYDWLLQQDKSIKIFMSGTGGSIFLKLIEDKVVTIDDIYRIPYDYSYANIKFYQKRCQVFDIINDLLENTNDKIIYFSNSINLAKTVYKQFKEYSIFRCSKDIKDSEALKYNDMSCIRAYNKDLITFDNRLLITTKTLDNGINIKDGKLKHIICDIFDFDSAQQCLGRKRILDKNDTCTFYILNWSKKAIGNFKGALHKKLNPIDLLAIDEKEFNNKYESDRTFHSDYIYYINGQRQYNKLAYWKMKNLDKEIKLCEKNTYLLQFLVHLKAKIYFDMLEDLEEYNMKDELELYLIELMGKKLFKEDQKELINQIGLKDKKGRLQSGLKSINSYLQENYNISVISNRETKRIDNNGNKNSNYGKLYWSIIRGIN